MSPRAEQLSLLLASEPDYSPNSFFVTDSNRQAWSWLNEWTSWPAHGLILTGAAQSGKTHLAKAWQSHTDAQFINTEALASNLDELCKHKKFFVLEDVDTLVPQLDQSLLFHFFNSSREHNAYVLLTARTNPKDWPLSLADLQSRLLSLPLVTLYEPDDDLLRAMMLKLFGDRQMDIDPKVINYLLPRVERSYAAVSDLVKAVEKESVQHNQRITIPFLKDILEEEDIAKLF
jgi:chromosomal replication initiation ATPase DnaA